MKTPVILLLVHVAAYLLMFVGKLVPGSFSNAIVAVGLTVEFPGWFLGFYFLKSALAALAFTFFFNAFLYYAGGLLIDMGTRARARRE